MLDTNPPHYSIQTTKVDTKCIKNSNQQILCFNMKGQRGNRCCDCLEALNFNELCKTKECMEFQSAVIQDQINGAKEQKYKLGDCKVDDVDIDELCKKLIPFNHICKKKFYKKDGKYTSVKYPRHRIQINKVNPFQEVDQTIISPDDNFMVSLLCPHLYTNINAFLVIDLFVYLNDLFIKLTEMVGFPIRTLKLNWMQDEYYVLNLVLSDSNKRMVYDSNDELDYIPQLITIITSQFEKVSNLTVRFEDTYVKFIGLYGCDKHLSLMLVHEPNFNLVKKYNATHQKNSNLGPFFLKFPTLQLLSQPLASTTDDAKVDVSFAWPSFVQPSNMSIFYDNLTVLVKKISRFNFSISDGYIKCISRIVLGWEMNPTNEHFASYLINVYQEGGKSVLIYEWDETETEDKILVATTDFMYFSYQLFYLFNKCFDATFVQGKLSKLTFYPNKEAAFMKTEGLPIWDYEQNLEELLKIEEFTSREANIFLNNYLDMP